MNPLRIVFLGTPAFAVPSLTSLLGSQHSIVAVVTQPDRRRGRGHHLAPEAVKQAALDHTLPVLQPERLNDTGFLDALDALQSDLGVVVAYGKLLTPRVLAAPRLGFINVHASLLPRWRGAAPVHRAILAGDVRTGVTIMRVVRALDAGPILMTDATDIGPMETSAELSERLAEAGAALLGRAVDALAAGRVAEHPQDDAGATYAKRLERAESRVDWSRPAQAVHNQIRGLQPWPMAAALLGGHRIAFLRSEVASAAPTTIAAGTISEVRPDAIDVACEPGVVRITEIQPEARRAMPVRAFLGGRPVIAGDRFAPLPVSEG